MQLANYLRSYIAMYIIIIINVAAAHRYFQSKAEDAAINKLSYAQFINKLVRLEQKEVRKIFWV